MVALASSDPQDKKFFVFDFPLSEQAWVQYEVASLLPADRYPTANASYEIRQLAAVINADPERQARGEQATHAETLLALRTLNQALQWVALRYFLDENPGGLARSLQWAEQKLGQDKVANLYQTFLELFPPLALKRTPMGSADFLATAKAGLSGRDLTTLEMFLLFLNVTNPAAREAEHLFDDGDLRTRASFLPFVTSMEDYLTDLEPVGSQGISLPHLLREPLLASPDSLAGQIAFIRDHWAHLLPAELLERLRFALDVLSEIDVTRTGEPGPPPVLEFKSRGDYSPDHEPEAFSRDADWMADVILMAKSVYVWLDQLSRWYGRPICTLAEIPDQELDKLARWGVNGLWLIGLWERSTASRTIKQWLGNPDAAASAYSLYDYTIAHDLGGEEAWRDLSERAGKRGIKLASDMVPNHMGIDSRWIVEHPEYFLQLDHPPYPAYKYGCENLCTSPGVGVRIEDGYWEKRDAAVVFQRIDEHSGATTYIYHGNDGTSMPWNDTAQLNFMLPQVREAVIQVILDVARRFPIIRFDAAMTLAKKHYQRLWFPAPGDAGAIPSRAEHGMTREEFDRVFPLEFWREVVDRVAAEAPDTLLLAEAFWLMEGYFVRTLGMHRVYNSAFMNMLKMEDNQKYRQTLKNVLEFSPGILQRFVNFMNNPDERTAVEQFGRGDKYFGCMVLLVTLPGLPMIGHGQIEGFTEKYGMEYRKAYWDEDIDQDMVSRHEREVFPLMRRRHLFSGSEHFALFDFTHDEGWVDENVFAYVNGAGNERVLILYNNAYDATAGFIHKSVAVNKGAADSPELQQTALVEALNLDGTAEAWYAFHDHTDSLQYLHNGQDLSTRGLHTRLNGFQYRTYTRIQRLSGGDAQWAGLAAELAGRGSANLEMDRLRHTLAPQLATIRAWMSPEILGSLECGSTPEGEPGAVLPPKPLLAELPEALSSLAQRLCALLQMPIPPELGSGTTGELKSLLAALPHSRALQVVYLAALLRESSQSQYELPDQGFELVVQDMTTILREWLGHDHPALSAAAAARLLAAYPQAPSAMAEGQIHWFADILQDPLAASTLGVNEHEGMTYISAEGLENWLLIVGTAALAAPSTPEPAPLLDARSLLMQKAAQAGYRLRDILTQIKA